MVLVTTSQMTWITAFLSSQGTGPPRRSSSLRTHRQLNLCRSGAADHPFQAGAVVGRRAAGEPVEELVRAPFEVLDLLLLLAADAVRGRLAWTYAQSKL
jgi:hypothetical protein